MSKLIWDAFGVFSRVHIDGSLHVVLVAAARFTVSFARALSLIGDARAVFAITRIRKGKRYITSSHLKVKSNTCENPSKVKGVMVILCGKSPFILDQLHPLSNRPFSKFMRNFFISVIVSLD